MQYGYFVGSNDLMRRLLIVVLLVFTGLASAQTDAATLPLIQLSSFSVERGEDLSLNASDLEPSSEYELSLTSPAGDQSTEIVRADEAGNLDYTVQLDEIGRWQLGLDRLEFSVTIDVQEPLGVVPDATGTDEDAAEPLDEASAESETDEAAEGADENTDETSSLQEETSEAFDPLLDPQDEADGPGSEDAEEIPALVPTPEAGPESTDETPIASPADSDLSSPNDSVNSGRRNPLEALATALGRSGWYGVVSLLLAIVALHMVLIAKYWVAQSVNLERRRILGRSVAVWSRAFAMRYYDLTEKLVLLLLFVAVAVMAALAAWSTPGASQESWNEAIVGVFRNPWTGLLNLRPGGMNDIVWTVIVVLFLSAVVITLIWLFIPRLRWVGNAPRNNIYHLLAALVPGSGLADEMWGLLLIIPWALFGLDALIDVMGWGFGLGLSLFWDVIIVAVIYVINLVAVIVEYLSYRNRMTVLKRDNPELAQEFGLLRSVQ